MRSTIDAMRISGMLAGIALAGCSYNIQTKPADDYGVALIYEKPQMEYRNLGVHAWGFYRPGFREPTLPDVWEDVAAKVRALGGNACVLRGQSVSPSTARSLEVTCEVLAVAQQ